MLQPLFTNRHYVGREGDKEKEGRGGREGEKKKRGKDEIERVKKKKAVEIKNDKYRANQKERRETEGEKIGCEVTWCLSRPSGACPVLSLSPTERGK